MSVKTSKVFSSRHIDDFVSEAVSAQQNHLNVDLCFICGDGQKIMLHKTMVCASDVLAQAMKGCQVEEDACIIFPDVTGQDLIAVVSALYTGFCQVDASRLENVTGVVELLNLPLVCEDEGVIPSTEEPHVIKKPKEMVKQKKQISILKKRCENLENENVEILTKRSSNENSFIIYTDTENNITNLNDCTENNVEIDDYTYDGGGLSVDTEEDIEDSEGGETNDVLVIELHEKTQPKRKSLIKPRQDFKEEGPEEVILIPNIGTSSKYTCDKCGKQFTKKQSLKDHDLIHLDIKPFKCSLCLKSFRHKQYLNVHEKIHKNERNFVCNLCDKRFPASSDLTKHMAVHTGSRPHSCDLCVKSFSRKNDLMRHILIHEGKKLNSQQMTNRHHSCNICEKSFSRKNDLTRHLMIHSGERPYGCTVCDAKFIGSGDLNKHIRTHTGEKPYPCSLVGCSKVFNQKGDLNKHMKIHSNERNFECSECDYRCIQGSDLALHTMTHTGMRPHKCDVCNKAFRRISELKVHAWKVHNATLENLHETALPEYAITQDQLQVICTEDLLTMDVVMEIDGQSVDAIEEKNQIIASPI